MSICESAIDMTQERSEPVGVCWVHVDQPPILLNLLFAIRFFPDLPICRSHDLPKNSARQKPRPPESFTPKTVLLFS